MKTQGTTRAQTKANLQVRDILRGMRYAVRKSGNFLADPAHQVLPDPLNDLTSRAVRKLDQLSGEVERATTIIGGPFQKSSSPDSSFFSEAGFKVDEHEGESDATASVLYYGLYYAFRQMTDSDILVSESLCLECILELERSDDGAETELQPTPAEVLATRLFTLIKQKQVFRRQPIKLSDDKQLSNDITAACFAVALWFFVPRDLDTANEQQLLDICCEVTQSHFNEIIDLQGDIDHSKELFQRLLNMI